MVASGTQNPEVVAALGPNLAQAIQDYSTGGVHYDPVLQSEALLASGVTQPPVWSWLFRTDGNIVGGKWVWKPETYPHLTALLTQG